MSATVADLKAVERLIAGLSTADRKALEVLAKPVLDKGWLPLPGPQTMAYQSEADELYYGGQAGGGKTDLLLGLALTSHEYALVLRRVNKEVRGLERRLTEIIGSRNGYNSQTGEWKLPDRVIEIGGCQHEDDKLGYQGRPHDLKAFDEITNFTETQYRFIIGWNRSANPKQRCRVVCAGNPPITAEGRWVIRYWAPWLDRSHPNPAKPGELRWFTTMDGVDTEVSGPEPVWDGKRMVQPRSRTFIPSTLEDNPYLDETGYGAVLGGLPAELRTAMRDGDFNAGLQDDEWQVIPTAWVDAAQGRWKADGHAGLRMTAVGCDVAQGGPDQTTLAYRYGTWFAPLVSRPGSDTPEVSDVAALIVANRRDGAAVVVDVGGGYGGGVVTWLKESEITAARFNGADGSTKRTADGALTFVNKRAEAWWRLREALDPSQEGGSPLALPNDPQLAADLTAPRWSLKTRGIQIEAKDEIKKRIGRSPDKGDAVVMAWSEGQALAERKAKGLVGTRRPQVVLGYAGQKRRR